MKTKYLCNSCGAELNERSLNTFASVKCPKCGKWVPKDIADTQYFPETQGNKVFAVDVYVTVCKCVKIEAKDADAAEIEAQKYLAGLRGGRTDKEFVEELSKDGFQDAEEQEIKASGEADENGDIEYY